MNTLDDTLDALETLEDNQPLAFNFPEFNNEYYYGIASEITQLATQKSEAAPMAVYMSFLTAASALLGNKKYLQIGESRHYARMFSTLVGASSRARKGTSFEPVRRIIRRAEEHYSQSHNNGIYQQSLVIANGGLSSAEGLIDQVRDESEETDDNGIAKRSGVSDKRLLVLEEEFANVLKMCKREGNTLSSTLRRAWDGGDLAPMTKNNKLKATAPHINLLAHITHFELKYLINESDIHNGLSNRFLWACVRRIKKIAFPEPMGTEMVEHLAAELAKAIAWSQNEGQVLLSTSARSYWNKAYHEVSKDDFGIIGSVTSRAEAYVMRLSLLFCLLDCEDYIEVKHIEAAIQLVDFCKESVRFIFSTPAESESGTDADKLLNALSEKPLSQSEISRVFAGNKSVSDLTKLLNELQSMNKIKQFQQEKSGKGRKAVMWEVI